MTEEQFKNLKQGDILIYTDETRKGKASKVRMKACSKYYFAGMRRIGAIAIDDNAHIIKCDATYKNFEVIS